MNLVPGRVRRENDSPDRFPILLTLNRFVAPQCFQRNAGLEIRRKSTSCRHPVFLRYPVEYTLTHCPISWDHLT